MLLPESYGQASTRPRCAVTIGPTGSPSRRHHGPLSTSIRTGLEIAAIVLLLFTALLDARITVVLAAALIVPLLGVEFTHRGRAS